MTELTKVEVEEIKEVLVMTILGEMLMEDGIKKGIRALIIDNLEEGTPENKIIQKLERLFSLSQESAEKYLEETKKMINLDQ